MLLVQLQVLTETKNVVRYVYFCKQIFFLTETKNVVRLIILIFLKAEREYSGIQAEVQKKKIDHKLDLVFRVKLCT